MSNHPKEACVNCHFFVRNHRSRDGSEFVMAVDEGKRAAAKADDFSWAENYGVLACHRGVWSEGFEADAKNRFPQIVQTDRRDFCFYWRYRPGMLLPAADILQRREAENREASTDRRITMIGLWIAALALMADVLLGLFGKK